VCGKLEENREVFALSYPHAVLDGNLYIRQRSLDHEVLTGRWAAVMIARNWRAHSIFATTFTANTINEYSALRHREPEPMK
jgi:hypothetical protein